MNIILWILQALLALLFGTGGTANMLWLEPARENMASLPYSVGFMRMIGTLQLLGAIGLVVPWATKIAPKLTPLAALGLIIIMLGAAGTHLAAGEISQIAVNVILIALLTVIAVGRWSTRTDRSEGASTLSSSA
ncbi:MAG: DoxX family protein [Deinococcota bacterium]